MSNSSDAATNERNRHIATGYDRVLELMEAERDAAIAKYGEVADADE